MKFTPLAIALGLALAPAAFGSQNAPASKSVQLTVYNANFALVRDTRSISFIKGVNSLDIEDVAAKIDPTSVLFKSLTAPNSVSILEQNYQYDLINPENILNKSVGQKVKFTVLDNAGQTHVQSGVILSPASNGGLVICADDGSIVLRPEGQVSLDKMPEGLHPKPTLNWLLRSENEGQQQAQISYITDGIGWNSNYVVLVNGDDSKLDLSGWVTVNNQSGTNYENAKLTLMAGDVRRTPRNEMRMAAKTAMYAADMAGAAPQFEEKSFFEYHMYTMERPTTIRDNETKQLSLLNASNVPVTKEMIYDGRGNWWNNWWYPGRQDYNPGGGYDTSDYHKVNVVLEVKNSKENGMGMPLPKGNVRVYKLDSDGGQQFIGEDDIDHTPKDEKIRLHVGDAFDVVGDYKRIDFKQISKNAIEETFQVNIRNHKDTAVKVSSIDHVWSDWEITSKTTAFIKKDAHTIEFPVTVPANGEVEIKYTIRTKWGS